MATTVSYAVAFLQDSDLIAIRRLRIVISIDSGGSCSRSEQEWFLYLIRF